MQIKFLCTCGKTLAADSTNAGKRAKCKHCGAVVVIPQPPAPKVAVASKAAAPEPAAEELSDDFGLGGTNESPWSDDDFVSAKPAVSDVQPNPYQAPVSTTAPRRKKQGSTGGFIKSLFSFNGRLPRSKFWAFQAVWIVTIMVLGGLMELLGDGATIIVVPVFFLMIGPMIAVQVKRWHDQDRSGAFILVNFIPFVGGMIALIMLGAIPGTPGPNSYGPDPLDR
jgi:uncharacterized membrane protein YhaH (DUF805 family)